MHLQVNLLYCVEFVTMHAYKRNIGNQVSRVCVCECVCGGGGGGQMNHNIRFGRSYMVEMPSKSGVLETSNFG